MLNRSMMLPRLGLMVFFQEFVYGSWLVSMGLILSKHGLSSIIGIAYAVGGIAAMLSPIFTGMLTDRFFSSQKVLAILNIIGGIILWFIPEQIYSGNGTTFLWLIFLYNLVFIPSYSLRNNISFRNIKNTKKDFPLINVFGTVGFIAAGLLLGMLGYSENPVSFQLGAVVSILTGLYNFTLPHTPPLDKDKPISVRDWFCLDALSLLKDRNYLVFLICTVLLFIPFTAYSSYASVLLEAVGFEKVASVMTIGQVSEVVFMLLLPLFFRRLGYKYVFFIGIVAWVVRSSLFALGAPEAITMLMYVTIGLHGFCWNFFFVAGFMYTDEKASPEIKSQAQGLLMMFSQGIGIFFGSLATGYLFENIVTNQGSDSLVQWGEFWTYVSVFTAFVAIIFFILFKNREKAIRKDETDGVSKAG
ncbi:MFS transporter [Peribacillus simplex]|uniref:MFS transporter n=1 Tax=Peribacillus simplex TaxID=1478 RepID=UPI00366CE3A7